MSLNVGKELSALRKMTIGELRDKYAAVFGEPTNGRNKDWLVKRIIWRMQALAEGDLTERARQRAAELANDADLRRKRPTSPTEAPTPAVITTTATLPRSDGDRVPPPGNFLTRIYKGATLEVKVLPHGFEFEGVVYKSLSAVAKKITGTHCNGYLFFRLGKKGGDQ